MLGYIVRRVIAGFLVLLAVSVGVFALFAYGPSDPAQARCPENRCTPQRLESIRENLGLDRPVPVQYAEYMKGIVTGREVSSGAIDIPCPAPCLGVSFKLRVNVFDYLWGRFPATFWLAAGSALVFLSVGVATGVLAARRRGTAADKLIVTGNLILNAIPYYLLLLLGFLYLVSSWGIFPDPEYNGFFTAGPVAWFTGLLLPWLVLGLWNSTQYARFTRGSMIESLNEDFVRTARSKGLPERVVILRHALRAAIAPVVTIFGLDFAILLGGTVFTERIMGIRGIGLAALNAIGNQDLPVISATVLIAATFVVTMNIVVDIVYSAIDPRVRLT